MITITHTHAEGTLIEGTDRGDGSRDVLRRHRCRWSRNLGAWFVPQSRDRNARGLETMADELRAAGFEVELSVDNERRAVADVQSDRLDRSARRAHGLAERAQSLDAQAAAGAARTRELMDVIPFGQPILVGHHSEKRHRAHIGRIDRSVQRTAETFREAEAARNGAAGAAANVARADSPAYIGNRIAEAEAELRRAKRGHRYIDGSGTKVFASEVERAEEAVRYWHEQMERIRGTGRRVFTRADISKGDAVKIRHGWGKVERVNPKTVSVMVGMPWPLKYKYAEIRDHRTAAQLAAAKTAEEAA